jgi:hypothetical protein
MWIAGVVLLLLVGAGLISVIGWAPRARTGPAVWDLPGASGIYSGLVYTLAGFSVAAATFLAGVSSARDSPAFSTVIGLLLLSFLILMAASMMYGATPASLTPAEKPDEFVAALWTVLANGVYLIGLALNWFALSPLLQVIELPALAMALVGPLMIVAVAGSMRLAFVTYRLTTATLRACLALPLLGVALPAGYRLLAAAA